MLYFFYKKKLIIKKNKNLYLNKNYNLSINIKDENTIDYTYSISVENTSTSTTYPQGNYVNYQRIYIPSNATVLSVNGMEENKFDTYKESGYKIVGGWFNTPIQSTKTLEVSYRVTRDKNTLTFPLEIDGKNIFFNLDIFKQAGESSHAYKLDLSYPSTWTVTSSGNLNSISSELSSRFELSKDQAFNIIWNSNN